MYCQRRELKYGEDAPEPERRGPWRINYDDQAIDWHLVNGDTEWGPGLKAVATYGHTVGHQSSAVRLDSAGRAGARVRIHLRTCDLMEKLEDDLAVESFIDCTLEDTLEAIRRLKVVAAQHG